MGVGRSSKFLIEEVNRESKKTKTFLFDNAEDLSTILKPMLQKNVGVLVKGSRSIGLDRVIDDIIS
jgi:UDP-N-acetylmuramyl pentapeptide synthase